MASSVRISLCVITALCFFSPCKGQIQGDTLILSSKVGPVIYKVDRDRFSLFPNFPGFERASFIRSKEGKYYANISYRDRNYVERDTVIEYSTALVFMLADKIAHYDELLAGKRIIQVQYIEIYTTRGEKLSYNIDVRLARESAMTVETDTSAVEEAPFLKESPFLKEEEMLFTFIPEKNPFGGFYPQFGIGIGLSSHGLTFNGIRPGFWAVEESYRKQGYAITKSATDWRSEALIWIHIKLRMSDSFTLALENGQTINGNAFFSGVTLAGQYYFQFRNEMLPRPYLSFGVGRFGYEVVESYENRIGPIEPDGKYLYLKDVTFKGSKFRVSLSGGLEYLPEKRGFGANVFVSYSFIPTVNETILSTVNISLPLSHVMVGACMHFYF